MIRRCPKHGWLCQPVSSNVAREFKPYLIRYGFKGRASCDWQMKQHSRLFKACFGHHFNPILSWSGFRISRFAKPLRSSTESAVFSQSKLNIIEATVTSELGYLQQKNRCYNLLWHQPWYANVLRTGCSQQSDMAVEKTWTVPQGGPLWTLNSLGISRTDQILLPNSWPFVAIYDH